MDTQISRSSYWDNAKAILIFLVVLAHYYGTGMVYKGLSGGLWLIPNSIYTFIYLFHMPLFAFISGYFSKHAAKGRSRAFSALLLPYLIVNTVFVILDREQVNPLLAPYGPMWYLLALFFWRMALPDVGRLKKCTLWGLGFSLVCLVLTPGKNYVSLKDAITFFPCFLLGYETSAEQIQKIRRLPKWLCALALLGAMGCVAAALGPLHQEFGDICFFSRHYGFALSSVKYLGIELARYAVALVLGACVLNLTPEKPTCFTRIGRNTLTVLIFHSVPHLRPLLDALNPLPESALFSLLWWTALSAAVTIALGSGRAARWFDRFMGLCRRLPPKKQTAQV